MFMPTFSSMTGRIAAGGLATLLIGAASPEGKWRRSELPDQQAVVLQLLAEHAAPSPCSETAPPADRGYLMLACSSGGLSAWVYGGHALQHDDTGNILAVVALDGEPGATTLGHLGQRSVEGRFQVTVFYFSEAMPLARDLQKHQHASVTLTSYCGRPFDLTFELAGLSAAFRHFTKDGCAP